MSQYKYNGRRLRYFDKDAENIIKTIRDVDGVMLTEAERYYVDFIVKGLKSIKSGTDILGNDITVWTKIKALYGFVGGTAATHKWNWKDMRDLDEAYRLSFLGGGWVHSATGAKGDGLGSYAETFLIPNNSLNQNNHGYDIFLKDGGQLVNNTILGVSPENRGAVVNTNNPTGIFVRLNSGTSISILTNNKDGYYSFQRTSSSFQQLYKDGRFSSETSASRLLPIQSIILSALKEIPSGSPERNSLFSASTLKTIIIREAIEESILKKIEHIITTAQGILGRK